MTREEKKNALHCLKVMIDEEVCEECDLYGTTGTDHCEADCVRVAIKALEQEPCPDAISRQEVLDLAKKGILISNDNYKCVCRAINDLPSVNLVKTGHWISTETKGVRYAFWCRYKCSLCGGLSDRTNFCPNCGAKMVEPQETETWNGIHAQITAPKGTFERILNDADDDNDI